MQNYFDQTINRYGTYSTQWDFAIDRFGRDDVLPFSISDMDFRSPPEIIKAIETYNHHGIFGYTRWNHDAYKTAIAHWYDTRFNTTIDKDWIVYSPSVIYSIAKLIDILTEPNDQVIIQTPGYDAFFKQMNAIDRELIKSPLIYKNGTYSIDFSHLEKVLSDSRAKVLLFCNPHNPTGRVWTETELQKIINICEEYGVKIISDDIHMDIVYPPHYYTPITKMAEHKDNIFICSSASKTFNTPSLGGSYAFIPDQEIQEQFLDIMKQKEGLSNPTIFGLLTIMVGYQNSAYWVDELLAYLRGNMQLVSSFIEKQLPSLTFIKPESTYLAWIDCSHLKQTDEEIQHALVEIGKVGIMSGKVYRVNEGKFLRMNVGCPKDKVKDGLQRLKKAIDSLE